MTSLKSQATKGVLWSAVDIFAVQGAQFVISIVLARLLMPEDFGLIGMISVFIVLSQVFIDSGMGSGLIQKKDRSELDFSTVFIFNFFVSLIFYFILFLSSSWISDFYRVPALSLILKILGINIVISSLSIVQRIKLEIAIDFKSLAKINVIAVVLSGFISIYAAYQGVGVWALVIQFMAKSALVSVLLWVRVKNIFLLKFSIVSFKKLFGYGSNILLVGLYGGVLREVYNIVIGKMFNPTALGYYVNAKQYTDQASGLFTSIILRVTFPILSSLQNERDRLISVYQRMIRMTSFAVFPAMTWLALLSKPIIIILLTEKWLPVVPLMQWLCFARMINPISTINMNLVNAVGRSDLYLKVDLSKLPLTIIALAITLPLGVEAMVIGQVVSTAIAFFINSYMPGKLFGYGALKQIKDMLPMIFATTIMAGFVYASILFINCMLGKILVGGIVGLSSYYLVSLLLKIDEVNEVNVVIKSLFLKSLE